MKKLNLLLIIISLTFIIITIKFNKNIEPLHYNQTVLYYMYTTDEGHYFLDPNQEYKNVVYVSLDDLYVDDSVSGGDAFIGTFEDDSLWELVSIVKE